MAIHNDTPDGALRPAFTLSPEHMQNVLELALALDRQLYDLLACQRFHGLAVHALLSQEVEAPHSPRWIHGLFMFQEWLSDQSDTVLKAMEDILALLDEANHAVKDAQGKATKQEVTP